MPHDAGGVLQWMTGGASRSVYVDVRCMCTESRQVPRRVGCTARHLGERWRCSSTGSTWCREYPPSSALSGEDGTTTGHRHETTRDIPASQYDCRDIIGDTTVVIPVPHEWITHNCVCSPCTSRSTHMYTTLRRHEGRMYKMMHINAGGDTAAQDSITAPQRHSSQAQRTGHRHRPPPPRATCSIMLGDARRLGRTLRLGVVAARGSWENSKDESERRAAQASARTRA